MAKPELVLLVGVQAAGKSTFVRERLFDSHVRINLDMLKTRAREQALLEICLATQQSCVVDNTNATASERQRYIGPARAAGFAICGFYFQSRIESALKRNRERDRVVPEKGVLDTHGRLEIPILDEGFDSLHYVQFDGEGGFEIEGWKP